MNVQETSRPASRPLRRSRIPLSCDPCRARKLKCNREKPCQNCTVRHEATSCEYRGPKNGSSLSAAHRDSNGDAMRQRIDNLEGLVKKLIAERQQPPSLVADAAPTPALEGSRPEEDLSLSDVSSKLQDVAGAGKTVMDGIHSVYVGGDDWYAVLQEINELKSAWNKEQDDQNDFNLQPPLSHTVDGSSLLFNQVKPIERIEIISALPPKPEVDLLVSHFFNYDTFPISVPPILHEPTFMREYELHWQDPDQTNFIWLGLLFSILGITMLAYHQYGEPPEYEGTSESLFQLYRMRTAQCLLSGDIAKCLPYTVETLRFNATAELNRKDDNRRGLWIMTGVVVRAAINMGYHREPPQHSGVSVLRAEIRRRIWSSVMSMDNMSSFLGGFPRTLLSVYSNTMEPRNIHDWELSEDISALPPPRTLAEHTSVTYLIVKGRLFSALSRISDVNYGHDPASYETVLDIDRALHEAYQNIPPQMQMPPTDANGNPPPIKTRANISNLSLMVTYHKGMCALHRRYLAKSRSDARFTLSRSRCIASALALLGYQRCIEASFYENSEARQMLILAAMILSLELELRHRAPETEPEPDNAALLQALERARDGWAEAMGATDEAGKVHRFLAGVLARFGGSGPATASSHQGVLLLSPETPFGFPGLGAPDGGFALEKGVDNVDFDWASWDAFIEENSYYDTGAIY